MIGTVKLPSDTSPANPWTKRAMEGILRKAKPWDPSMGAFFEVNALEAIGLGANAMSGALNWNSQHNLPVLRSYRLPQRMGCLVVLVSDWVEWLGKMTPHLKAQALPMAYTAVKRTYMLRRHLVRQYPNQLLREWLIANRPKE